MIPAPEPGPVAPVHHHDRYIQAALNGESQNVAGASKGGWTVVAVHDSKQSWEMFRDEILMPRMQQGIKGGFKTPPQETPFEVYNLGT